MATELNVLTHHKCGSRWMASLLSRIAHENNMSFNESILGVFDRPKDVSIFFSSNAYYPNLLRCLDRPTIHFIRNPLNIICSAYYSHLSSHSLSGWPDLAAQRDVLRRCSKQEGLFLTLSFLESVEFYPETPGPLCSLSTWNFDDPDIVTLRIEDAFADMRGCLGQTLGDLGITDLRLPENREFTFEQFSNGRKQGVVDNASHYRSGGTQDTWRSELPEPVIDYIRSHYKDLLERFYPASMS